MPKINFSIINTTASRNTTRPLSRLVARHLLADRALQHRLFPLLQVGNNGWTATEAWNQAKSDDMKARFSGMGELRNDVPTLLKYKADDDWMIYARSVFLTDCRCVPRPRRRGRHRPEPDRRLLPARHPRSPTLPT